MKKYLIIISFFFIGTNVYSQQIPRFNPDTLKTIVIDSAVANIVSHKLNAQDFIDAMLADTGFYQAFRNMKKFAFDAENRVYVYDKHNKVEGKIYRNIKHSVVKGAVKLDIVAKRDSGQVYKKNGKYDLYTVEMFDYIFMNAYNSEFLKGNASDAEKGKNAGYKAKLKTLIFTPGRKVTGIPFISNKTEIFGPDLKQFYQYQFARGKYLDTIPVYRFKITPKPSTADDDVMIKEVTTIFDTRTFQILGRYIDLKFHNFLVDFNVQMNIECNNVNGQLVPTKITYQGNWDIPFHKEERASFLIIQKNYRESR